MNADDWSRLREMFDAVEDADPAERERLIPQLCAGRPDLERELRALVCAAQRPDPFIDESIPQRLVQKPAPGDVLCDRFELQRQLGVGGMGEVWAARDRSLEEIVAVKLIRHAQLNDGEGLARFKREIQLARKISHPNVCRVYELFEDRTRPTPLAFLTMEMLEGETLAAHLAEHGALGYPTTVAVLKDVAAGLHAAHLAGVIHRDLKPANVMLVDTGASRRAVVMDFGLARGLLADGGTQTTRSVVGTPEYMAPEQITGAPASAATDVYALGLLLFEMLTGRPPFAGANTFESFMRRAREGPERLGGVVDGVPLQVDQVLARCLQYEPAQRFPSVPDVLAALGASTSRWRLPSRRARIAAAAVVTLVGVGYVVNAVRPVPAVPQDAQRWYADAQQALADGATVRALNDITRATAAAPEFASAHAAAAEILLELDMPVRAQEAILVASRVLLERGARDAKEQDYVEGIQSLLLRSCDEAEQRLESRSRRGAVLDPYELLTTARALERCGRPDASELVLAQAAQLDSRNAAVPLRKARLLARRPDYAAAMAELATAESLFRDRNNIEGVAEVLATRGTLQAEQDRLAEAEVTLQKAGEVALSLDDTRQQVRVLLARAIVRRKQGELASANVLTREATSLARGAGLETLILEGLFTAANVHVVSNQFSEAKALFEQALAVADTHRDDASRARARLSLATVFVRSMEHDRALEAIDAARSYYERTGHQRNLRIADTLVAQVLMHRGQYGEAATTYRTVLETARKDGDPEQETAALENLATAQVGMGRYAEAAKAYEQALAVHREAGRTRNITFTLLNLADAWSRLGRFADAERALIEVGEDDRMPSELEAQLLAVRAAHSLRRERFAQATQDAERAERMNAGASLERASRIQLARCAAAGALARFRDATRLCDAVAEQTNGGKHPAIAVEAQLTLAEVALRATDFPAAGRALQAVETTLPAGEQEHRWRLLALRAALSKTGTGVDAAETSLARELESLRLKLGEGNFDTWRRRPDVRRLIAVNQPAAGDGQ